MPLNTAEEENIEALKRWWDENGKFLLLLLLLGAAGFGGWNYWSGSRNAAADAAAGLYQEIVDLSFEEAEAEDAEAEDAEAEHAEAVFAIADRLQTEHASSRYTHFAALFAARQAVAQDDLAAAAAYLQWILDNEQDGFLREADAGLVLAATLRLGRILLAQGELERALALVNGVDPRTFEPGFAELRGDIYQAMGRPVDAREAYAAARQAGSNSDLLLMKIDNLAPLPEPDPVTEEPSTPDG